MYQSYPIAVGQPRDRFDIFQGAIDSVFCSMQIEVDRHTRERFSAAMEGIDLPGGRLMRVAGSPLTVRRRREDIGRMIHAPYLIKFQSKGESWWHQRDRQIHLRPGDFIICSTAEPYVLTFRGDYEMPVLLIPEPAMRLLTPDPEQFLGVRMSGEDADCGVLSGFVGQVAARMERLSADMARRVEGNVLDLLGGVLSARSRRGANRRSQQLARIKAHIAGHLRDRRLTPAAIANAIGVTPRQVHAIFKAEDISIARYIQAQRVVACRAVLERTSVSSRPSLTDLALSWGFYDLSHMTRCFKKICGFPPGYFLLKAPA